MAIAVTLHNQKIHVGDTVGVHYKIIEKDIVSGKTKKEKHEEQKERTQVFEGMVIGIRGAGDGKSFVVRRMGIDNVGIERIFPVVSPWIKKVTVTRRGDVRRAKLYYLRAKTKKEVARIGTLVDTPAQIETKATPESKPAQG
ncbi:TPA: 50S ribosomal protein L19 [Patescibacteria group bacterium]|uniref:50S ribosomal protein L19 n=1 Tax=Candidatus Gottesmanbacteria bacterium GW2011_GWA1_43_11 TaxID=1618436 RepID=A0A0G1EK83_9BACT|nr:MAG: 50S ribosomal protein L19 [Candidatus Gottesmanbacteria bacterium GW2011_GWA1_43_11]HCS79025.1 50S ribosomal protein L19 [Patescibacteria group bacterium]